MTKSIQLIEHLRAIFPKYLVLLSLFPLLIGGIIDFDLVESRELIIDLVWLPFFTIPVLVLGKRFIFQLVNFFYFMVGFIQISHWVILKGPISLTSILVISNTNYQEAIEFFDLKATYGLLILLPFALVYLLSTRQPTPHINSPYRSYTLLIVLLISTIFIAENTIHGRLIRKGIPHFAKVAISFHDKIGLYREASRKNAINKIDGKAPSDTDSQIFVLILGESCNRNHMSLYGYSKETTPKLDNRNDIIVFDNVVSPYSNTLNSVLTILSEANLENGIEITKGIDVIDVFHAADYKTYWISNQSPIGIWDNLVTVLANKTDSKKFVNISSNSSFEATYTASFDSKLLKPFSQVLEEPAKRKFIVVHLMGSHSSYSKRYPETYDDFKGNDSKSRTIGAYDNSVLYNDFIVDSLLKILDRVSLENNIVSSAIYLSDHGENVYDEFNRVGHDYSKTLPKANVEIPFMVWVSDHYVKLRPEKVNDIRSNRHKPFVSDDLFHSILGINSITSSVFDTKRSIFSNVYNDQRKRILEDNENYDEK